MYVGGVLKQVDGLTYDRLSYFVRANYIKPKKIKRGSLYYNDFSEEDIKLIKLAWDLISKHDLRTRTAFKTAREKAKDPQLTLNLRIPPNNSD